MRREHEETTQYYTQHYRGIFLILLFTTKLNKSNIKAPYTVHAQRQLVVLSFVRLVPFHLLCSF